MAGFDKTNVLECAGDSFNQGQVQGQLFASQLRRLPESIGQLVPKGIPALSALATFVGAALSRFGGRALQRDLETHYPQANERLRGIAAGAGVELPTLHLATAVELLLNKSVYHRPKAACTAVAVTGNASATGEPIIAKNFDYPDVALDQYLVRRSRPDVGAASLEVTVAPLPGCHEGINEHGLAVAYNYGHFSGHPVGKVSITTLCQHLLERCESVAEVLELLPTLPRAGGALLMVADASAAIASIELSPDSFAVRFGCDHGGRLAHSNHAITPEMVARDVPTDAIVPRWWPTKETRGQRYHESSEYRHQRASQLLAANNLGDDELEALLSDHNADSSLGQGDDNSICRHGSYYRTTCSVLLFPMRREVRVLFGSPCKQSFVAVPLRPPASVLQRNIMSKYSGTVHKNDLEGGFWELRTADGERYQLRAADKSLFVQGQRVEIDGDVDKGKFGIGMVGSLLDVKSWTRI